MVEVVRRFYLFGADINVLPSIHAAGAIAVSAAARSNILFIVFLKMYPFPASTQALMLRDEAYFLRI